MYDNLARRAIMAALSNDWESALEANLEILANEEEDTDALNRAARAYLQLGDLQSASVFAQKVIEIDPLNTIAQKCFAKCNSIGTSGVMSKMFPVPEGMFLEIPGKTRIVSLVNLGEAAVIARLDAGENVSLLPKTHRVAVTSISEVYLGRLPDDLATRMIYLHRNGNKYEACIKSATDQEVKIFIKETERAKSIAHVPSFPVR